MPHYNLSFVSVPFIPVEKHKGGVLPSPSSEAVEPICPVRKTEGSIGVDLATPYDFTLPPNETAVVELGLVWKPELFVWKPELSFMREYCLLILSRSGLASRGIFVVNAPGLIDTDYTGPTDTLKVILNNLSSTPHHFKRGDRIAQVVVAPFPVLSSCAVVEAPVSWANSPSDVISRGGLGSTGN